MAEAHYALARAEANETLPAGLYWAHVGKAKKRIERALDELKRWEGEHPDE